MSTSGASAVAMQSLLLRDVLHNGRERVMWQKGHGEHHTSTHTHTHAHTQWPPVRRSQSRLHECRHHILVIFTLGGVVR